MQVAHVDRFVGMSLEEIAEKYGKQTANEVYAHAALGLGDLTKIRPISQPVENYETVFDVMIRTRESEGDTPAWRRTSVQVWLRANAYTQAKRDQMIGSFDFNQLYRCYEGPYPPEMVYQIKSILDRA